MTTFPLMSNILQTWLLDQINHSPDITTEDYAYEIKGGGLFSRDILFSLRSPISVKAGEQVKYFSSEVLKCFSQNIVLAVLA